MLGTSSDCTELRWLCWPLLSAPRASWLGGPGGARVHWTWDRGRGRGPDTSKQTQLCYSEIITQRPFPYHLRKQSFKQQYKSHSAQVWINVNMNKYVFLEPETDIITDMSTGDKMETA